MFTSHHTSRLEQELLNHLHPQHQDTQQERTEHRQTDRRHCRQPRVGLHFTNRDQARPSTSTRDPRSSVMSTQLLAVPWPSCPGTACDNQAQSYTPLDLRSVPTCTLFCFAVECAGPLLAICTLPFCWSRAPTNDGYRSTGAVRQPENTCKSPSTPNSLIISGAGRGQISWHCLRVRCETLAVLQYPRWRCWGAHRAGTSFETALMALMSASSCALLHSVPAPLTPFAAAVLTCTSVNADERSSAAASMPTSALTPPLRPSRQSAPWTLLACAPCRTYTPHALVARSSKQ